MFGVRWQRGSGQDQRGMLYGQGHAGQEGLRVKWYKDARHYNGRSRYQGLTMLTQGGV